MNHNLYFSMREAELKRQTERQAAENWRKAHPNHRPWRWRQQFAQFEHVLNRAAERARVWLSRPTKPQEQCC